MVGINISNGTIQLRFLWEGKRKKVALGLKDTPEHRKIAKQKVELLKHDILFNIVDPTFNKYRIIIRNQRPLKKSKNSLPVLWDQYIEHRKLEVSPNTYENQYLAVSSHLEACSIKDPEKAPQVRDWLLDNRTYDTARRTIEQLSACCRHHGIDDPYRALKLPTRPNGAKPDPFSSEERSTILKAFEGSQYLFIIKFLFMTGARTGEARGLPWENVASDLSYIDFNTALSGRRNHKTKTKNHRQRRLPCSAQLIDLLGSTPRRGPDDLVCPVGKIGTFQTTWRREVRKLVELNLVNRYRPQYHTRHTFITECIEAGVPIPTVAVWVGDRPETILKHYAGILNKYVPPEIL